jgi:hypothetical protein
LKIGRDSKNKIGLFGFLGIAKRSHAFSFYIVFDNDFLQKKGKK